MQPSRPLTLSAHSQPRTCRRPTVHPTLAGWIDRRRVPRRELPGTARPLRPEPGRGQGPRNPSPAGRTREETVVQVTGGHRQPAGPRWCGDHRPGDRAADRAGADAADRAVATDGRRRPAARTRQRARSPCATRRPGGLGDGRGGAARVPHGAGRTGLHRDPDARRSSVRRPSPERTSSRWTTSAGRRTWPSRRSSTSRRWSGCSSGSSRSARCSVPSRTTRSGTSPSTSRWTPSSALSRTTATFSPYCESVAGMLAAGERAAPALVRLGVQLPEIRSRCRFIHFSEALAPVRTRTSRTWAPADERAIGEWALREPTAASSSRSRATRCEAAVLHTP